MSATAFGGRSEVTARSPHTQPVSEPVDRGQQRFTGPLVSNTAASAGAQSSTTSSHHYSYPLEVQIYEGLRKLRPTFEVYSRY